jgi:5-formyltetrahydrofolate cyclo-ligase
MSDKASLRNRYLHKRDLLSKIQRERLNVQIARQLRILLQALSFTSVHTYLSQSGNKEIDTLRIISLIREDFKCTRIVVPRIIPRTKFMEHYLLTTETRLVLNRWLIPEPDPATSEQVQVSDIDLVLIPLLAFDLQGFRVGYGGGYYDRFLSDCGENTLKIGLSFFDPVDRIIDIDHFDIPMDYCVTADKIFNWDK